MERNYDEIIADLLSQVDKHSEELSKHSRELAIVSKESREAHRALLQQLASMKKDSRQFQSDQQKINSETLKRFQAIEADHQSFQADQEKIHNIHLEQLVHSATILDRIIKKNDLRV